MCRYIRYIYNRIILENATVRAAAVSALANFGAKVGGHGMGVFGGMWWVGPQGAVVTAGAASICAVMLVVGGSNVC
jgi:hypothetical protein